jgi:membrane protein DedA with SNARE-associated domain
MGGSEFFGRYIFVFLGSIIEGDATLVSAAFLANRGRLSFVGVLLTAGLATVLSNELVYHLSRNRSRGWVARKVANHPKYARTQEWIRRRSTVLLLFSRYLFGFRLAIPAACALTGMRPAYFSVLNAVGAMIWVVPLGLLGYAFGGVIGRFWHNLHLYEWHIAVVALAIGWTFLARYDPELHMVASIFLRTRQFAVTESARVRNLGRLSLWRPSKTKPRRVL